MKLLKYKFIRFLIFMMLWVILGQMIYLFIQPKFKKPNENFTICVKSVIKDDRPLPLPLYSIQDYKSNPNQFKLCTTPINDQDESGIARLELYQNADQSYLLKTWNDSMADPVEYHYKIVNNNIEPIAWRHGTTASKIASYFYGLIVGAIIYKLVKRLYVKKNS